MEAEPTPWLHYSLPPLPRSEPLLRRTPGLPRDREPTEQSPPDMMQNSKHFLDRVDAFLARHAGQFSPSGPAGRG